MHACVSNIGLTLMLAIDADRLGGFLFLRIKTRAWIPSIVLPVVIVAQLVRGDITCSAMASTTFFA